MAIGICEDIKPGSIVYHPRLCEKVKEMKEFKENLIKRNKERRAFLNSLQTHVVKLKELGGPLNQLMSSVSRLLYTFLFL